MAELKYLKVELEQERDALKQTLETLGLEARRTSEAANAHRLAGNEESLGFFRVKLEDLNRRLSETRRRLLEVGWELEDRFGIAETEGESGT